MNGVSYKHGKEILEYGNFKKDYETNEEYFGGKIKFFIMQLNQKLKIFNEDCSNSDLSSCYTIKKGSLLIRFGV
jgi:hypothetical protein